MFTHNIYRNVRTRVIVVREGMLLHAPFDDATGRDPYRGLPGGGMKPNESLYECGEREVCEETGLTVRVASLAFLREWVVPKTVPTEVARRHGESLWFPESSDGDGLPEHAYGLEVYLWAEIPEGAQAEPKPGDENITGGLAEWVPLELVPDEPLFPTELKALARDLAEGRARAGVPAFVRTPGSPWDRAEGNHVHPEHLPKPESASVDRAGWEDADPAAAGCGGRESAAAGGGAGGRAASE